MHEADEGHPVRRKDRRQHPLHAGQLLRRSEQRQQERHPLGHGHDADPGSRRRGNLVRRETGAERREVRREGTAGVESGEVEVSDRPSIRMMIPA